MNLNYEKLMSEPTPAGPIDRILDAFKRYAADHNLIEATDLYVPAGMEAELDAHFAPGGRTGREGLARMAVERIHWDAPAFKVDNPNLTSRTTMPPAPISVPFHTRPRPVHAPDGRQLRPYVVVMGGTLIPHLDTPEKIGGLRRMIPGILRHADIRIENPPTRGVEVDHARGFTDVQPDPAGPVPDAIARIPFDVVIGYTPEAIAEHIKQKVLDAFRAAGIPDTWQAVSPVTPRSASGGDGSSQPRPPEPMTEPESYDWVHGKQY